MSLKSTNRILRAIVARLLCLAHMGLSIFVLYSVKKDFIYLIPTIGAIFLVAETALIVILFKGKEPTQWISTAFLIYVPTIVSCYWFLELENVRKMLLGKLIRNYKITHADLTGDLVKSIRIIWSQVELQMFFALIMFIRWLIPKSNLTPHGLSDLLFKYFAISCDMLDFLTITQDLTLMQNNQLVYWTLGVWSWSTIQFFLFVPKFDDEEKNEFTAYITNSLLSVLFLDLPFFGVRVVAIFAFGSHNYNSYFFATKNFVLIALQMYRIKATFLERTIRENRAAKKLKDRVGFDKEASRLFDHNEMAKRNFIAHRLKMANSADELNETQLKIENPTHYDENLQPMSPNSQNRLPRMIETVKKQPKQVDSNNSLDNISTEEELESRKPRSGSNESQVQVNESHRALPNKPRQPENIRQNYLAFNLPMGETQPKRSLYSPSRTVNSQKHTEV